MASFFTFVSSDSEDMVNQYAIKMLYLGLFYYEYGDAIKEGDGSRILRCWQYLLPMFLSCGRCNYAIETMHTLMKHDYLLSSREANELLWGRFINVHGLPARNIPNDLHNEHLNRTCKTPLKNLGPNKTAQCITRIGRAIGTMVPVLTSLIRLTVFHSLLEPIILQAQKNDLKILLDVLTDAAVFF